VSKKKIVIMAICFHGNGTILLKKENAKKFVDKFIELAKQYGTDDKITCEKDVLLKFETYARHFFMSDLIEMLKENIENVECCDAWFSCDDEDSFDDEGFPFINFIEISNGKIYEQTLYRRLPCDWLYHLDSITGDSSLAEERKISNSAVSIKTDDEEDDFPF
jgi:hypothetical protein